MSQRVAKVESLIQQVVAKSLVAALEADAARVSVTRVDAAADLRNAIVWVDVLAEPDQVESLWARVEAARHLMQQALGETMTTKFVPRLTLKRDTGGEYADKIERLLKRI